ncbi:MAG: BlaI/MecI/CopY family transcriptional regulator [Planctomycetes bacterium]|nr:BlaI/MecI/CopY family transcriptional regulator [Planctomycetota bacterium]
MDKKPIDQLGKLQGAIMEAVWLLGQATVHEVRDHLRKKKKELAYTTVLTALQRLEKAGLLKHRRSGKSHVYYATRTREQAGARSVQRLVKSIFGGDRLLMLQHLLADDPLSKGETAELRNLIDRKRREKKDAK